MTILQELTEYSENCLKDLCISEYEDYISCKKHKWACRRFLADIKKAKKKSCAYEWNEEEAQRIVDWFAYLRHSKGVLAGKPIELTSWQKFNLCQLYGWRMKGSGLKRFHHVFIMVGRKNGKSQMMAGVMLYEIAVASTMNEEIYEAYTTGVKREQSKIIFNEAKLMLKGSPLQTKFRCTNHEIRHNKTSSTLKTLSKDDKRTGDGTNPAALCIDELHQHPTMEFVDLFLGANTKDPTLFIITTAGMDLNFPAYTVEYKYCSQILDPHTEIENDDYLIDILEVDQSVARNMKKLAEERYWHMANPIRMSYPDGQAKIRAAYKEATAAPEKMTAFMTKMLDIWVQARENGYMDMGKWKACEVEKIPINTVGLPVYVGFDMSAKIDLTSVAFVIPYETKDKDEQGNPVVKYIIYSHSFIPSREAMQRRKMTDHFDYDMCERLGFLSVTDTPIVDQSYVMRYVLETCRKNKWEIQCLCFDPANASKLMLDLSNEGFDVEEVYQSHKSLNEATEGFREQVYSRNVLYTYNPLLTFAMGNAVVKRSQGLIKIDKDASILRIDPVDAVLAAYKLALYHVFGSNKLDDIDKFLEMEL